MSGLLESTLGAVGQAGEALDKVTGGRALRGALAGKPRELASFVPFSDTMGLTNKADATSGRDLTDAYGLTKKGDNSFGSHAAGFAADMVASPLSLLGGYGAFKAAPTVAKGLVGAGKAITGLDAVEHAGGALKRFAGFGAGQSDDVLKAAKMVPPKPVDTAAMASEHLSANVTRPRRWSADPAERAYYSADRGRRYAERMSGKEIPRPGVGAGIPEFSLADDILKPARNKPDTYGMASPGAARKAMDEAQPIGHGPFVEPTESAVYKLKSGPIAGGPKQSGVGKIDAVLPPHAPDADLVSAYENMTAGFPRHGAPSHYSIPDEVRAMPNEMRSLGEAKSIADQGVAANATKPSLMDRVRGMFGGGTEDVVKPARMNPQAVQADSLLQHRPWADRTDITPTTRNAAEWVGPGFGGGRDKMAGIMDEGRANKVSHRFDTLEGALMNHPLLTKIAGEFPEDSKFLGHGAEALAAISGDGHVIRAAPAQSWLGSSGRADIPQIVQPFRSIKIPGNKALKSDPWVVEHLPKVNPIQASGSKYNQVRDLLMAVQASGDPDAIRQGHQALQAIENSAHDAGGISWDLGQAVKDSHPNLDPWDFRAHNVSLTNEGRAIGHDGGMARKFDTSDLITRYSPTVAADSARAKAAKLGGQDAVREALANGVTRGAGGQGLGPEDGILGIPQAIQRQNLINGFLSKYGHMANPSAASLSGVNGFQSAPNALAQELARVPVATPSSQFAIHSGGTDRLAPGLLSRLMGGGPSVSPSVAGGNLPWQRAVQIGNEAGFPTSMLKPGDAKAISRAQGWGMDQLKDTPAWYSAKRNKIEVNPFAPAWHDSDAMAQHMLASGPDQAGWFSSGHPDHIINHETGHGMHAQSVGAERFQFDPELNTPFTPGGDEHNFFRNTLSEYGATQPDEAIAEIVAALKGGRELNPSLIPALKDWGGPQMFQNLGDHGLLKGLGLSLLGTLGVGGAVSQQQGA